MILLSFVLVALTVYAIAYMLLNKGTFIASIGSPNRGGVSTYKSTQLKGILAIIIIVHHVSLRYLDEPIISQFKIWGAVAVAIFFLLSGYGLIKSYLAKKESYLRGFLRKRFGKLLPPFLIATIIWIIIKLTFGNSPESIFNKLIVGEPPLPNSWFVYTIIFYYLAFYFCAKNSKSLSVLNTYMLLITIAYCFVVKYILHWGSWWVNAVSAFNIGMFIASYEKYLLKRLSENPILRLVCLSIVLLLASLIALQTDKAILYNIPICMLSWVVLLVIPDAKSHMLSKLGTYSYEIYIVHGGVISILDKSCIFSEIGGFLAIIFACVLSLPIAICLKYFTKKITANQFNN